MENGQHTKSIIFKQSERVKEIDLLKPFMTNWAKAFQQC